MAFGSAAPEIVVNAVTTIKQATAKTHGPGSDEPSIGVGAIIGSGIIAFLLIPGVCALAVNDDIQLLLKRRPLLRDVGTYAISLLLLCIFFNDGIIQFYEAATLVGLYGVYVVVVVCAPKVRRIFRVHYLGKEHKESKSFIQQARDREAANTRTSLLNGAAASFSAKESDSLMSVNGLNYGAGNNNDNDESGIDFNGESSTNIRRDDLVFNEKDLGIVQEDINAAHEREGRRSSTGSFVNRIGGLDEDDDNEDDDNEDSTCIGRTIWKLAWPLRMLFMITCPNCEEGSKYDWLYPITFLVSFVWVAFFSFIISTVVERWVHLGISNGSALGGEWYGLVLISIGAEIPDAIQSVTVARRGYGSMAVSNAIGSQIINILIGLGLPWMITDMVKGNCIRLYAHKSLQYAAFFQFAIVGTFLALLLGVALIFGQNKAILTKSKARFLMSGYFVVLIAFTLIELYAKPANATHLPCPGN